MFSEYQSFLQNNRMELYGLTKAIDKHCFGDDQSIKMFYVSRQKNKAVKKIVSRPSVVKLGNFGMSVNDKFRK